VTLVTLPLGKKFAEQRKDYLAFDSARLALLQYMDHPLPVMAKICYTFTDGSSWTKNKLYIPAGALQEILGVFYLVLHADSFTYLYCIRTS